VALQDLTMTDRTFAFRTAVLALTVALPGFGSGSAFAQAPATAVGVAAQPSPSSAPRQTPPINGIAHIAIRVKDIAASVAFYKKLGFEQAFAMNKGDVVTQSFIKVNNRQFIELYPVTDRDPQAGFLHLCFEGADLNALHDFYVAEGLTPIAVRKAGAGNLLFTMKGPQQFSEPQNIEYTQYMPGSLHSNDNGQHLGADRVADKMVVVSLAMQDPAAARNYYKDKLDFVPVGGGSRLAWRFGLPGTSGEEVEIVPVENLGAKSSIILTAKDIHVSGALLQKNGIAFEDADALIVTDPDGNTLRIVPQDAFVRGK
jgi:catechol 2,3-dioxygenase-like lactoylglutathione lyase family enzyme